jgi:DNA helicase-2/ATP-dependent DNA helicase PcrA
MSLVESLQPQRTWVDDQTAWEAPDESPDPAQSSCEPRVVAAAVAPLSTAADLHATGAAEVREVSADEFHQGMLVRHPEYGLGKVIALGGSGARRSATVAFASDAGQKKFILRHSPLRPAVCSTGVAPVAPPTLK